MSQIVTTKVGRFRRVNLGPPDNQDTWLFECPGCNTWAYLDADQWAGRVSVDHASQGCPGRYHETHEFGKALVAMIAASQMTGQVPYSEED